MIVNEILSLFFFSLLIPNRRHIDGDVPTRWNGKVAAYLHITEKLIFFLFLLPSRFAFVFNSYHDSIFNLDYVCFF